ncbi:MAG: flagellar export chaperone FliS [Phycisphaerales bacterium]
MSQANTATAYLRTRVMTASPEQLRLLLLEGAVRFAQQAREGLEAKDYEKAHSGFSQCRAIVLELLGSVRPGPDPELGERVKSLYSFMYNELIEASFNKDAARLGKVIDLLEYEVETWKMLMDKLAVERGGRPAGGDEGERAPLSVEA